MTEYDPAKIANLITIGKDKDKTTKERGDALEELVCYLLSKLPGIKIRRNARDPFHSQEIDIAVASAGEARWLKAFPSVFLVECKNWDSTVGVEAVSRFILKVRTASVDLGIIVAANGISGDRKTLMSSYHTTAIAQGMLGCRILVITLDQLQSLNDTEDFEDLLIECFLDCIIAAEYRGL